MFIYPALKPNVKIDLPNRDLPRAIAVSLIMVMFCYLMANVAFYTTLSVKEVLESPAVAVV